MSNETALCDGCVHFCWIGSCKHKYCSKFYEHLSIAEDGKSYKKLPECIAKYSFPPEA
jgi:hypothetical protein